MSEKINSVSAAFEERQIDINKLPDVSMIPERFRNAMIVFYKSLVTSEAIREGWKPDYENIMQDKWEAWHDLNTDDSNPSGFRFLDSLDSNAGSNSVVGPLHCQETEEKCEHFAKVMEDDFRSVMKPKKD